MKYFTTIAILAGINVIAVSGCTVLTGFAGMFSMGQAGFMIIGAYTSACFAMYAHIPFLLAVFLGRADFSADCVVGRLPCFEKQPYWRLFCCVHARLWRSHSLDSREY